ncbi:hypothetical protein L1887_26319 [Cichorium endivia]|nr:hypothetical protein L1887_26319 [Cichorium endivia]
MESDTWVTSNQLYSHKSLILTCFFFFIVASVYSLRLYRHSTCLVILYKFKISCRIHIYNIACVTATL